MRRTLYYGDNLEVMRQLPDELVDLIYLDPPFNSNADYNVIFREQSGEGTGAQITAFEDTWQWGSESARQLDELVHVHGGLAELLDQTVRRLGHNALSAYLVMMAPRLVEMQRLLKPTGSLYLHCDPTASHYLKLILDEVFGPLCFRAEVRWKRTSAHSDARRNYAQVSDSLLFFTKADRYTFERQYVPYSGAHLKKFAGTDPDGRRYTTRDLRSPSPRPNLTYAYTAANGVTYQPHPNGWSVSKERMRQLEAEGRLYFPKNPGGRIRMKSYLDELSGVALGDIWDDIPPINSQATERLGYPTQKPLALLERIIQASSNPGDLVLDPFCGCGTAVVAAQKLDRAWIGIDITHLAVALIQARLKRDFGLESGQDYALEGTPKDLESARYLFNQGADGPYQFQFWAAGLVGAQPHGVASSGRPKKGGDTGIDGKIYFRTPGGERLESVVVSVKGGKQLNPGMIRDLESVVRREKAAIGVFLSLETPTSGMYQEAAKHGFYEYGVGPDLKPIGYPRIQILTVEDLLAGKRPQIPVGAANVSLENRQAKSARTDARGKAMAGLFDDGR